MSSSVGRIRNAQAFVVRKASFFVFSCRQHFTHLQSMQVSTTPPDESRRKKIQAEAMASNEIAATLVLKPFQSFPKIEFSDVKLGRASRRRLAVQNPGKKPVKVKKIHHVLFHMLYQYLILPLRFKSIISLVLKRPVSRLISSNSRFLLDTKPF